MIDAKKILAAGWIVGLLASGLVMTGCSRDDAASTSGSDNGTGSALSGTINVEGSDTMVNMAQGWAAAFMEKNPEVMVTIKGGGSGTGVAALINGTTDVANASREMKQEEITQAQEKGIDPVETEVAFDGIAVIANPANPVADLTMDQLGKIYRGEITNWKDVGGSDRAIVLLSRDPSSGTYEYFKEAVVGKDKEYAKAAKLLPSTQSIVDEVKKNADAIGYVGVGYLTGDVKDITIEGVKPSVDTVLDKSYPLSRGLYVYTNGQPSGVIKAYIDFVLSADGQKTVTDEGFVPLAK